MLYPGEHCDKLHQILLLSRRLSNNHHTLYQWGDLMCAGKGACESLLVVTVA